MNKTLVIVAVSMVLLAVYVGYARLFPGSSTSVPAEPVVETIFPAGESAPPELVAAPTVSLPSASGTVSVRNFLKDEDVKEDKLNPGLYFLGAAASEQDTNFSIDYTAQTGFFNITLLSTPLASARTQAEAVLREHLKLSNEQLCALRYSVAVPAFVNVDLSGTDYRFSFCSDTLPL